MKRICLPIGMLEVLTTAKENRAYYIAKFGISLLIANNLEQFKEFADTVTAMVAAEEERQERITKEEA